MSRPATMFYWSARACFATDAGGRRTVLVKGPKSKANRELALQRLAELLGSYPLQAAAPACITVAELVDRYLSHCAARVASGELKASSLALSERPYGNLIKKECGDWIAGRIDQAKVRTYRRDLLSRKLSPTTVWNRLRTLRRILRWAKRNRLITIDVQYLVPSVTPRRRERIPTASEIEILLKAVAPVVRDVLETILNAPVRPGELYSLLRRDVDLDANLLRLPDSKTGARLVCIVPKVHEILKRRLASTSSEDDFVFTSRRGRRWTIRHFAECVRLARKKVGLGQHVVAYSLRHVWTTGAFLRNVPLHTVRALRGDRDINTTLIYDHLAQHVSHLQQAARQAVGLPPADEGDPDKRPDPPGEPESHHRSDTDEVDRA